ncbi:PIN domain-containing protein [Leptospira licerasiae]|uniref:PIN domain protein n=1 Tax=Leptospira licerasiae str. MMD4847 TaxID=1049971 RepID=A0ABN0H6L2_9LEPT|nr:PIN domain-containing protein [Leptospira licerasiae]EID99760.1 toxin-antitoxin system, toxin component, PIN family [Leptospira licerasiae serovar Varillal str. VAR 010]EJZ41463.1 PIN domain protein [Leptospira licerasiae str. MMD4847]
MVLYIDTSLLLNILYAEAGYQDHLDYFNRSDLKFGSILLEIESFRSLHFTYSKEGKSLPKTWFKDAESFLGEFISQINLKNLDADIRTEIQKNKEVLELKSLDAAHLATALHIRKSISDDLILCSMDEKFRSVAKKMGFKLYPKK